MFEISQDLKILFHSHHWCWTSHYIIFETIEDLAQTLNFKIHLHYHNFNVFIFFLSPGYENFHFWNNSKRTYIKVQLKISTRNGSFFTLMFYTLKDKTSWFDLSNFHEVPLTESIPQFTFCDPALNSIHQYCIGQNI